MLILCMTVLRRSFDRKLYTQWHGRNGMGDWAIQKCNFQLLSKGPHDVHLNLVDSNTPSKTQPELSAGAKEKLIWWGCAHM